MLIERIWTGNSLRNFNFLIACPQTGDALAIDPLDGAQCLSRARELGWHIRQVFNTHEHEDHTSGNAAVVAATGAEVLAHRGAVGRIAGVGRALQGGEILKVGSSVTLRAIDTPGHTRAHLCLLYQGHATAAPALFCGDTLFNGGAGNCTGGGDPDLLYHTFARDLRPLADNTRVYPGHEYLLRNLGFALDREPSNDAARELERRLRAVPAADMPVLTMGDERKINPFLRLGSTEIHQRLGTEAMAADARDTRPLEQRVFCALRALRNRW